jgi:DNA repair exonuclease SbcCD ATPase subunit
MKKELQKSLNNEIQIETKLISNLATKLFESASKEISAEKITEFQRNSQTVAKNEEQLQKISSETKLKTEISSKLKDVSADLHRKEKEKSVLLNELSDALFTAEAVFEKVVSVASTVDTDNIFAEYSRKKQELHNIQAEINSVSEQVQNSGILNKLGLNLKLMGFRRNFAVTQKAFSQFKISATEKMVETGVFSENSAVTGELAAKFEALSAQWDTITSISEERDSLTTNLADCEARLSVLLEGLPQIAKTHSLKKEINECNEILSKLLITEGTVYIQKFIDDDGNLSKGAKKEDFFQDLELISQEKQKIASLNRQILIEKCTDEATAAGKKIENLKKSITDNENRIKYLTEENSDFTSKITSLEDSIRVLNEQIAELQAKEKEASKKNGKKSS